MLNTRLSIVDETALNERLRFALPAFSLTTVISHPLVKFDHRAAGGVPGQGHVGRGAVVIRPTDKPRSVPKAKPKRSLLGGLK
jgi:hypothetical protein